MSLKYLQIGHVYDVYWMYIVHLLSVRENEGLCNRREG